jgi:NAD(P)-dependent dehydrogenase (short-subunit alcohol dehydrogenase family)
MISSACRTVNEHLRSGDIRNSFRENELILDQFRLDGKTAIVTGAARGLGHAMALGFAEAGANLVLNARDPRTLETAVQEIRVLGGQAVAVPGDITDAMVQDEVVSAAVERFSGINILLNNAGTTHRQPAVEFPLEEWRRVMELNLTAAFQMMQKAGKVMMRGGGGSIINVGSLIAVIGMPGVPAYGASKAGLEELTRCLAVEWAPHGIRVNTIQPGYFLTDLTAGLDKDPDRGPKIATRIPMQRWGKPDELKGTAVFLASEASSYITGAAITVDGGWLAG